MNEHYKKLGNLIRQQRLKKGFSTQELADSLGVSIGFISNLENAKTDTFNFELMINLCKELDISPFNFLPPSEGDLRLAGSSLSKQLNEVPINIKDLFSQNVDAVINRYFESLKNHNFDLQFSDTLTKKLISELDYIDNFELR